MNSIPPVFLPLKSPLAKESPHRKYCEGFQGGFERIRTAVAAFAELCLTARPRNHA